MKDPYSKPSMVRVGNPLYAKHGSSAQSYPLIRQSIEGAAIKDLVKKYGSPLFVFSERLMREKYRQAYDAVRSVYPNVRFGWSYKTNYLAAVCRVFHQEGALAEVVSQFEYEKARHHGVPGGQIIFNGPHKPMDALRRAVREGSMINADHFGELEDLETVGKELKKPVKVGVRLNLNAGIYPIWSRFGFNLENGQAAAAVRRVVSSKTLKLAGVHCHLGTFILDSAAYGRAAAKLSEFVRAAESMTGKPIEYLDLGGGIPSRSHLKGVYQPPEIAVPGVETYAAVLGANLKWLLSRKSPPRLLLENGRHLVDEAGYLITTVSAEKLLPDGRRAYVLDAGINILYTSTWYKFKIELDRETGGVMEPSILLGPLCMNIDVVDEAVLLPRLSRGQSMVLSPVGAYNVTQWMQFIQYRPAVVMVRESGEPLVIRRAETLADVTACENDLPDDEHRK
ncbi:MAG: diaminopimelate decarboxylase [Elusimicrobia bacterium RBG_16_66_12]|nr:MAG: diaminopimelate decarboxylase [Elusimicrobia bacterium RBG_16_66_12]